jgi:sulfotransferase family protein
MVEVIGAGFGRTGTASLKRALETLGFWPCHHMSEVLKQPATAAGWTAALAPLSAAMAARGFRRDLDEPGTIAVFERHNAEVRAGVEAGRLLVYEVGQGWAPLCDFLGTRVPETPFPSGNDADTFAENVDKAAHTGADFD